MSDIAKKVLWSVCLSIPSAAVGVILRGVFQTWGIFDPFSEWLGGWLKMHITPAQAEWTVAGIIAVAGYATLLFIVWRQHRILPIDGVQPSADVSQQRRNIISSTEIQQPESSPQRIGLPLQIECGNDERYERTEHVNETGIFRRMIYVSIFNDSLNDIYDCNLRLIAATPRPNTCGNPTQFPALFGAKFDLRGKQTKFIQIVRFAENPGGNPSTLERDNIIISIASGGLFQGWTTIPIPSRDNPAILTLEAFAHCIESRTAHLHIWVIQRRIHAQII